MFILPVALFTAYEFYRLHKINEYVIYYSVLTGYCIAFFAVYVFLRKQLGVLCELYPEFIIFNGFFSVFVFFLISGIRIALKYEVRFQINNAYLVFLLDISLSSFYAVFANVVELFI